MTCGEGGTVRRSQFTVRGSRFAVHGFVIVLVVVLVLEKGAQVSAKLIDPDGVATPQLEGSRF